MYLRYSALALAVSLATVAGCKPAPTPIDQSKIIEATVVLTENQKADALFEKIFQQSVDNSPETQTALGLKTNYDQWDDLSEAQIQKELEQAKEQLAQVQALNMQSLDTGRQLSVKLLTARLQARLDDAKWELYSYPVNQMYGTHSDVPSLLINQHSISDESDAKAYIGRLKGVTTYFKQLEQQLQARADIGVLPPKFVFAHVIGASRNIISGAPFDGGNDSTLLADFRGKVQELKLEQAEKDLLLKEAELALVGSVKPAYENLIKLLTTLEEKAGTEDGVWRFKDGDEFYANSLARITTTDYSAEKIHQLGLSEVARIHEEMKGIMKKVGFKGDLQQFFAFMRDDPQFYYPDTAEGKAEYLAEATRLIDTMKSRLDELFIVKPKADMVVKAVEPFREQSAGKAFYEQPSMDGSRPGIYYANLYRMSGMPKYQMEALAYHEGIPGHHMQIAIAQELDNVPKFRKFGGYTAYIEGWGLYTEFLPKEIGMYQDPYSDFGRLAMELWRACRLVVDTGLHNKKWTREQAIQYLVDTTPNSKGEAVNAIERYIVMPGQATAYTVGMLKMLELREKAKTALGDKFDIRQFHDVVLKNGAVPLDVLEQLVDQYIQSAKAAA
ncbi:MAG: DUF885 domain-containing protein [Gammaproteobacteria bacterium]|nr:DUF885 domain-containing protein [Gammaproteobacteria bacterium]MBU2056635.1 DUF885 domain-containing protein [Gammaproteobacteria bacterium]MBU2173972.1 DUF885 domain-containing protein [Gammaproteobacteria bacterium]MBU2247278.1 DUF885 domain-containing protein [Gammaproteobacteria bacterium]MBU2344936.1 DUF885 domain-containing protein [Gammaproteobacteria bacterium]